MVIEGGDGSYNRHFVNPSVQEGVFSTEAFPYLEEWLPSYGLNYYYAAVALALTIWGMGTIKDVESLSHVEIERIYGNRMEKSEGSSNGTESKDPNYGSLK